MLKKSIIIIAFLTYGLAAFLPVEAQNRVYVNYVTHNEDTYPYLINPDSYLSIRTKLIQFALSCNSAGAKWCMGNDYVFLQAVYLNDTGSVVLNTDGKNLLQWLNENMGVECDPHSHESIYNYTDVAYLHTLLNVEPSSVRSGFIYNSANNHGGTWMDYQEPVVGDTFPSYTWYPEVIWGAGTLNHVNDPRYYGMWKPTDTTDFFVHEPENRLINYGGGCKIVASDMSAIAILELIDDLIDNIDSEEIPIDGFYCMSIFFEQSYLANNWFALRLDSINDGINERVTEGNIQWKSIEEVAEIWKTEYASEPFYMSCDYENIYPELSISDEYAPSFEQQTITSGFLKVKVEGRTKIAVYNLYGEVIINDIIDEDNSYLDLSYQKNGLYLVRFADKSGIYSYKVLLAK